MLKLEKITAGYGSSTVLRDVDIVVPTGSVAALLGPNGAGKTSLLRVASGVIKPSAGRVVLNGEDVTGRSSSERARRGLCHVPEGRGIFPPLTVRQNLILFSPPGKERQSIERAVEAFPDLSSRLTQTAGTLSGGQQQMVSLSRALISDAEVVLLDEVSMGLAPIIVDQIYEFIHALAASGRAILLVEQYVNKALDVADYVYILTRGRSTFAGDVRELDDDDVFSHYLGIEVS